MNASFPASSSLASTPSTQAYLSYTYQYQSLRLRSAEGSFTLPEAAEGARKGRGRAGEAEGEGGAGSGAAADILDLRNSRGLQPSRETILSILEEKVSVRVEAAFPAEKALESEAADYWSAEKTGERIARFALKFYDRYAEKHGESEAALEDFLKYVKGAIDEGFGQARTEIAEVGGGSIDGEKSSLIDATYDKVLSVLEEFRQSVLERLRAGSPNEESKASAETPAKPEALPQIV